MIWDKAFGMHKDMVTKELEVRRGKAKDYSSDVNVLSNFQCMAEVCAALDRHGCGIDITTSWGYAMFMVLMKAIRFLNIINQRNGSPINEALDDTVLDGRVYWELARECYAERGLECESK